MNMISSGLQTGIMNSLNDDLNHKKIDKLHAQLSNCTYQDEY